MSPSRSRHASTVLKASVAGALGLALASCVSASATLQTLPVTCVREAELCGWSVAWRNSGTTIGSVEKDRTASVEIENLGDGVGFVERRLDLPPGRGLRVLRMSAAVAAKELEGKGAGLQLVVLGQDRRTIATLNSAGYADSGLVRGDVVAEPEIVAVLPPEAASLRLGLISRGAGRARFDDVRVTVQPVGTKISTTGRRLVDEAVAIMREHSLKRADVDLDRLADEAYRVAGTAREPRDAYPAIRHLLSGLEDHHSFLMTAEERAAWVNGTLAASAGIAPASRVVEGFGYISVPGFHGNGSAEKAAFAQAVQDQLRALDESGVAGWIVDLRRNDGGNAYPMLSALAPLLDEPVVGYFVDVNGSRKPWGGAEAVYRPDRQHLFVPVARPVTLSRRRPIAVLFGPATGSSGEMLILSFIGNRDTRSFGRASLGLTTGNEVFPLSDGSALFLAASRMADRTGRIYDGPVEPDVTVAPGPAGQDAEMEAAIGWLRSRS